MCTRPGVWNTDAAWGAPARLLHWAIALLVLVQIGSGWAAVKWPLSPTKLDLYVWHKSTGMLILVLMTVRIAWRLANIAPSLPTGMKPVERIAAQGSHLLLYLLLILMPITGWIVSSASNIPFRIFWVIPLVSIADPDKAIADAAARVHFALFVALSLLLVVHIGAALRHHFLKRNDVLVRMLPGRGAAR
jgi:cytochrome b561